MTEQSQFVDAARDLNDTLGRFLNDINLADQVRADRIAEAYK